MKTKVLLSVEVVTDGWAPGDEPGAMEYGAPYPDTERWVNQPGNRGKLTAYLRHLATCCESGRAPFRISTEGPR